MDTYLEKIGAKFNNSGERQEIMEDIEARIAELFQERIDKHKEVITELDVNHIKDVLGSPDNFEGEEEENTSSESEKKESKTTNIKRLYRDLDEKVVGGVCMGVSNYFGWEVSIVRVIWIFSFLLLGFGMWIYIILWAVIPEAKSTADKLKMKGKKANLENIESFFKSFKKDVKGMNTDHVKENVRKQSSRFNQFLLGTSKKIEENIKPKENIKKLFGFIRKIVFPVIGIILAVIGASFLFSGLFGYSDSSIFRFVKDDFIVDLSTVDTFMYKSNWFVYSLFALLFSIGLGILLFGLRFLFYGNKQFLKVIKSIRNSNVFIFIFSLACVIIILIINDIGYGSYSYRNSAEINSKVIYLEKLETKNTAGIRKNIDFEIIYKKDNSIKKPYLKFNNFSEGFQSNKMLNRRSKLEYEIKDSLVKISPYIICRK